MFLRLLMIIFDKPKTNVINSLLVARSGHAVVLYNRKECGKWPTQSGHVIVVVLPVKNERRKVMTKTDSDVLEEP